MANRRCSPAHVGCVHGLRVTTCVSGRHHWRWHVVVYNMVLHWCVLIERILRQPVLCKVQSSAGTALMVALVVLAALSVAKESSTCGLRASTQTSVEVIDRRERRRWMAGK